MNELDWTIIGVYLAGLIALSVFLGRGQETTEDYYVGGRKLPWWSVGISTMATQTGVISFISIPAFVAIKEGGGLTWLQYELAVPLAMIFIMVLLIPFFRKLELVSVYEYLEHRYDPSVRMTISAVFQVSRALAGGVTVYATSIVLQVCTGLPLWVIIAVVGVVTIVYDTIGGMKAVVWSDVIQMGVLVGGLVLCIVYAVEYAGGVSAVFEAVPDDRLRAIEPSLGLDGEPVPFWAFLLGGFFLYASYYGTDQSQTQRELSAPTLADTKRSLVFNGLARFPLTLGYLGLGLALGAALTQLPELAAAVTGEGSDPDELVPRFVVGHLPGGLRAVLVAAMLAAAMSSLDSTLNSLSATTMRDFIERGRHLTPRRALWTGRVTTIVWGVIITAFAFVVGNISDTVIEAINKVGSVTYGPILATFVVGVLSARVSGPAMLAGVASGVSVNLYLWLGQPQIHWMWWNLTGFAVATAVALAGAIAAPASSSARAYTLSGAGMWAEEKKWLGTYGVLAGYFVAILLVALLLTRMAP